MRLRCPQCCLYLCGVQAPGLAVSCCIYPPSTARCCGRYVGSGNWRLWSCRRDFRR
ncbi:hypothetical protein PF008_g10930 [Phytophthora fragariae]|uniref:Uncharacterized protein n=1 Tax=Phytophthora fragariae TaxID=53985 RepID=A0A6G0RT78_9STRA|nr:hypothetical protein PF008_g10930 [Phytophthora fragariae]